MKQLQALEWVEDKGVFKLDGELQPSYRNVSLVKNAVKDALALAEEFEKNLTGAEFLGWHNGRPVVDSGKITGLEFYDPFTSSYDEPLNPTPEQFERLRLNPDCDLGSVEPHPEGADRGGYVPTLDNGCHFCETANEWYG